MSRIPYILTLQAINIRLQSRIGTSCWGTEVLPGQQWLLGSLPELADPNNNVYLTFKSGPWTICSHYDHIWSMWGYYQDIDVPLTYTRSTEDSSVYGFMSKEAVLKAREDVRDEEEEFGEEVSPDRIQDFLIDRAEQLGGNVEFGRGADTYYLYVAKEGDHIVAWALLLDSMIDDILGNP